MAFHGDPNFYNFNTFGLHDRGVRNESPSHTVETCTCEACTSARALMASNPEAYVSESPQERQGILRRISSLMQDLITPTVRVRQLEQARTSPHSDAFERALAQQRGELQRVQAQLQQQASQYIGMPATPSVLQQMRETLAQQVASAFGVPAELLAERHITGEHSITVRDTHGHYRTVAHSAGEDLNLSEAELRELYQQALNMPLTSTDAENKPVASPAPKPLELPPKEEFKPGRIIDLEG